MWYSGLTRYSSIPGEMIVNSSQGGGFKDTWVLSSKTRATRDSSPGTEPGAPLRKLAAHSTALARTPLPECVAEGMRLLALDLSARGYKGAEDRLCSILAGEGRADGAPAA